MNPPAPTARAPGRVPSLAVGLYVAVCLGRPALSASFAAAASAVHARTHIHTSTESAHGVRSGCSQLRRAYLQPGPWLPWLVACHVERGVPRSVSKQPWREHEAPAHRSDHTQPQPHTATATATHTRVPRQRSKTNIFFCALRRWRYSRWFCSTFLPSNSAGATGAHREAASEKRHTAHSMPWRGYSKHTHRQSATPQ